MSKVKINHIVARWVWISRIGSRSFYQISIRRSTNINGFVQISPLLLRFSKTTECILIIFAKFWRIFITISELYIYLDYAILPNSFGWMIGRLRFHFAYPVFFLEGLCICVSECEYERTTLPLRQSATHFIWI